MRNVCRRFASWPPRNIYYIPAPRDGDFFGTRLCTRDATRPSVVCPRRDEETARAHERASQVYLVSSFILLQTGLQGDSLGSRHGGVHRATGAIRGDASYAIGRDWPCANPAYHSRTLLFSPLAELRRGRAGERIRERREIRDREKREQ